MSRITRKTFDLEKVKFVFRTYWPQITILLILIILLSFLFPRGKALKYSFQLNDIAREPIIAPFTFSILKTEEKLDHDLEEALISEPFLFNRSQAVVDERTEALAEFFQLSSEIRMARDRFNESIDLLYKYRYHERYQQVRSVYYSDSTNLAILFNQFASRYPFTVDKEGWTAFLDYPEDGEPQISLNTFYDDILQICRNRWAEGIYDIAREAITSNEITVNQGDVPILAQPEDYNDLNAAWTKAKEELIGLYPEEQDPRRQLGNELIVEFMKPNLIYDKETTERRQQARMDRVPRHQGVVLKDEMIVDANTRITQDILHQLYSLSVAVSKQTEVESTQEWLKSYLGRIIIIGVVVSFFFSFLLIYRGYLYKQWKLVFLIALIFAIELGLSYLFVIRFGWSEYLVPITVAAMVFTILFDARIGFMGTTSIAILAGIMMGNNLDFIVIALFTSSVAMYNVRQLRTRYQLFTTIFALMAASLVVVAGIGLFKGHSIPVVWFDLRLLLLNSFLAPIVTYGLVGLFEIAFGVTTDLTLLELLDFDHPLLKRSQQETNGTFNHSIVVGNLAESCANAIGAHALLCRVGAYYHDIGKMARPEYFIENQYTGVNRHDTLTPVMSAKTIRNHVKEGLRLAEEYGIPKIVSDFIPMHHGTTLVEYFYRKALEETEEGTRVDESAFRYPGPKPNTKETGILMICEAVEAAVRSLKDPDIFKIEEMIDKIINKRLKEGQLDECPLTLDELRKIKGTVSGTTGMLPVLRGIYHIRVEYPEDKKESREAAAASLPGI